jgi:hypothetical protein
MSPQRESELAISELISAAVTIAPPKPFLNTKISIHCIVGILFGAFVVRQFPIKSVCKRSAFYLVVSQTLTISMSFAILIPGCQNINMAGVSASYTER